MFARSTLIALLLAALPSAFGQDTSIPEMPAGGSVSFEQLESSIGAIEARQDIDDETRAKVIEQLRDAESQLKRRTAAEAAATAYTQALDSVPAETLRLQSILDEEVPPPPTTESLNIDDDTSFAALEQALAKASADLAAVDARLSDFDSQIQSQVGRPLAANARINELRDSREQLALVIAAPPPAAEHRDLTDARRLAARLRRSAQAAEINQLEQESLSHAVRLNLLRAQRDVAARSRVSNEQRVELIRTRLNAKREAIALLAQQSAAAAELAAVDRHPVVQRLAQGNATLTRELPAIAAKIAQTSGKLNQVENEVDSVAQRLAQSRQRLEIGGVNRVIGRLLIEEDRNLPLVSQYRSDVRERRTTLAETGLAQLQVQEQRRALTPLDARVELAMTEIAGDITAEEEIDKARAEVTVLLRDRRDLLNQVDDNYRNYLQVLGELNVAERRLLEVAADYREFLGRNLMWIPSAPIFGTDGWQDFGAAAAWALSPASWTATVSAALDLLREHMTAAFILVLLLISLLLPRRPLSAHYKSMNSRVGSLTSDNIGLTLAALAIDAFRTLPLPLLLVTIGWIVEHGEGPSAFSLGVARAFFAVAPFLYSVLLFRALAGKNAVARVHFGWREESLAIIRRQLDRVVAIGIPLAFTTVLLYSSSVSADRASLGRAAFVAMMVTFSLAIHAIAHPASGAVAYYYNRQPLNWVRKLKWPLYFLTAGIPLLLALLALIGYVYTSATLTGLLIDTIMLLVGLTVVNMVALRWLALAHRKIARQVARKEREAKVADGNSDPVLQGATELPAIEQDPLDLDEVDQQTRKLLQSGLFLVAVLAGWGIWAEALPALNLFERFELWSRIVMIEGVETIVPVTLADVLLAVVAAAVTAVAYRNLPGLMEIAVLQRLSLQPGSRYAISTLVRYFVVTIGAFSVLSIVGWDWSRIQWMVAALSVGLGFGLQEIVANFVSGLIILFERPVRVGDTVTVGTLTGTVSRVRIRATTITDWDRKEIIVPNKAFITEQVINWSLTDPITRIVIPVGIAYKSDIELARRVMEDTLRSLPQVLDEPPPQVYFVGFGDSSLDYLLHVYVRQLSDRLPLTNAVHESILTALRTHDIQIPFPQRDLHVRSTVETSRELPGTAPTAG